MKLLTKQGIFCLLQLCTICFACVSQPIYQKQKVKIPMRDGVELNTEIYIPEGTEESLPIILTRTPYGLGHDAKGIHTSLTSAYTWLAEERYIFVFQDIRGRYESEGQFVMMRPARNRKDDTSIDEGTDTFDSIEWLLKNLSNHNGKVGMMGISYGGWLTVMALIEPHPSLIAVSPQASPSDMYIGDDFVHNGALRLSPAFGYAALMESGKTNSPYKYDQRDTYEFFLDLGPLSNANDKYLKGSIPSWNNFVEHPNYDPYWKDINVDHHLKHVPVAILNVAGWWDAEDFYGPLKIYETLEKYDQKNMNYLVVGPWRHGGWARDKGDKLGSINFSTPTGEYYRKEIEAKWFAYHLKGKGVWNNKEAMVFETGSNQWTQFDEWPPVKGIRKVKLYFNGNGKVSFKPPQETGEVYDSYISDPANPVPYMTRPIKGFWQDASAKALWKVADQRFVHGRPDVLSWESDVLSEDMTISGNIIAHLMGSTSGTDCDWVVKLIDVYPENYEEPEMSGYQLMIADEVFRAKFRGGFEKPEALIPGRVVEYPINLYGRNHTFKKGHRIMVQVQSTWFPLIDRNPQTFIDIPKATEKDYRKAEQRIYRSSTQASFIELPVKIEKK